MVKIQGHRRHSQRLRNMSGSGMVSEVGRAVYVTADMLRTEARRLVNDGAIQGDGHVPSRPGEPPNTDTRNLVNQMTVHKTGALKAEYRSNAPYSAYLEYGTSQMAERPFVRPAVANTKNERERFIRDAVNRVIRRS